MYPVALGGVYIAIVYGVHMCRLTFDEFTQIDGSMFRFINCC